MSIDFSGYLSGGLSIIAGQGGLRAQVQRARILDKETEIELKRGDTHLASQSFRVEFDNSYSEMDGASGDGFARRLTIFGIQSHSTLVDSDIRVWDTFTLDDMEFTVTSVNKQIIGQIQAHAEAV